MKIGKLRQLEFKGRFTYLKNVPFDENGLKCPGSKFQIVKFLPGSEIKPHFHRKTYEIFYVRGGNGILSMNGQDFRCKPDDFFLCEPGDSHAFKNDTKEDFIILIFKTNEPKQGDIFWENGKERLK